VVLAAARVRAIPGDRLLMHWLRAGQECLRRPGATGAPVIGTATRYTWKPSGAVRGSAKPTRRVEAVERAALRQDEVLGRAARSLEPHVLEPDRRCSHQGHAIALVAHDRATEADLNHALGLLRRAGDWHPGLIRALLARERRPYAGSDLVSLLHGAHEPGSPGNRLAALVGPLFDYFLPSALHGADRATLQHFAAQPLRRAGRALLVASPRLVEVIDVAGPKLRTTAAQTSASGRIQWQLYRGGMRAEVLANPHLDERVVLLALQDPSVANRRAAGAGARLSARLFAHVLRLRTGIPAEVATNPHLTAPQLQVLLRDPEQAVRAAALGNPALGVDDVAVLAGQGRGADVAVHVLDQL
jgi:hypothetical protein